MLCLLGGMCVAALAVSSVTSSLRTLDAESEEHYKQLSTLNHYLRYKRVPVELQ